MKIIMSTVLCSICCLAIVFIFILVVITEAVLKSVTGEKHFAEISKCQGSLGMQEVEYKYLWSSYIIVFW